MKYNRFVWIMILLFLGLSVIFAQDNKPKIAVLDLSSLGGLNPENAMIVRENLTTSFVKTKKYRVVERSMLNKIFQEMKLVNSDEFSQDEAIEIGKLAQAKYVVTGSLSKTSETYFLNIRVIEVETAEIVYAENERFASIYESDFVTDTIAASIAGLSSSKQLRVKKKTDVGSSRRFSGKNIAGVVLTVTSSLLVASVVPFAVVSAVYYDQDYKKWSAEYDEVTNQKPFGKKSASDYASENGVFIGCLVSAILCPLTGILGLIIFAPWITEKSRVAMALSHVEVGYRYGLTNEGVCVGMRYSF